MTQAKIMYPVSPECMHYTTEYSTAIGYRSPGGDVAGIGFFACPRQQGYAQFISAKARSVMARLTVLSLLYIPRYPGRSVVSDIVNN